MNFIKKNWYKLVIFIYFLVVPVFILYADGPNNACDPTQGKICNPLGTTTELPALIQNILLAALKIGIPIVALAVIYSGFLFVSARGNSEKLTKAKDTLMYTLIGAAILLGSVAIAKMIESTMVALTS